MRQNMDDSGGAQCREATLCIKAPKFSGKTDWEAFKARFELLAMAAGWSEEHKALQLAMCLTDDADACLLLLSPEERKDYGAQVRALQRRYGQINQPLILRSEFINRRRQPELQKTAADMFGMEAALFCISVSMGNLIAVMAHCMQRGDEMIVGDVSHLHVFEQGASAQLAGVHSTTVTTLPDGTFDLDQLESKIRHGYPNAQYPRSRLICLENTHTIQGGRVLPLSFLQEVRALADQYGLSVHMDGARVLNAAVAQGVPLSTILQHTHTVSVCLSKGLGAPVGSVLAGSQDFISRATRCRKALGGGMWLAGMLAAAAKVSLQNMVGRLVEDHHNAKTFAQALLDCQPPLFAVDVAAVETNIVRFRLQDPSLSPPEFCARMAQVGKGEEAALGQGIQVLMYPFYGNSIRAVWHHGISPEDTQLAIQKMRFVASQHLKEKVRAQ